VNDFRLVGGLWAIPCIAAVGALLFVIGWWSWTAAEWLAGVSWWWFPVFLNAAMMGLLFLLTGLGCIWVAFWAGVARIVGRRVLRVDDDGIWVWRPLVWWSRFVPFESVRWVKREQPKEGVDVVWIVHGPNLTNESVGMGQIHPADYDALLALLADRCPAAFAPDPPEGWRPPID
jgi:hypothetical protein